MNGTKKLNLGEITSQPNGSSDGSGTYMNAPISDENGHAYDWCNVCT